jgi:hypothetical protein
MDERMKVGIVASKHYVDNKQLEAVNELSKLHYESIVYGDPLEIVSMFDGGHSGNLAVENLCKKHKIANKQVKVDWNDLHATAVLIRTNYYGEYNLLAGQNATDEVVRYVAENDGVVVIMDDRTPETKDAIKICKLAGVKTVIVKLEPIKKVKKK